MDKKEEGEKREMMRLKEIGREMKRRSGEKERMIDKKRGGR